MQKSLLKFTAVLSFIFISQAKFAVAQEEDLPIGFSQSELQNMSRSDYSAPFAAPLGITTPPPGPLRTMGQWEEIQALTVTWRSYESVLREIVRAARLETVVIINCNTVSGSSTYKDSTAIKTYLTAGGVPLSNIRFNAVASNSVWMRDYGPNSVYTNDVDSLLLVDWVYNRPRPQDDVLPNSLATMLNIPIYETTTGANKLINTGGNWICDGLGTSFHSNLIMLENPTLSVSQVDNILNSFMGITRSIKMDTLPYDGIHHLDMHMKLLNEETLLVGQYPAGISDGPQIEANIAWLVANYNSAFGTPYKVIRIPQPPDITGPWTGYPDAGGDYLTYTNATIINKTVIIPQYYATYDTTAMRIWKDAMPGYNVVGINSNTTISASGSLHCITHTIGVADPLLIVHQNLPNTTNTTTPYQVDARIQHKSGIALATLYYTTDTATIPYTAVSMTLTSAPANTWTGFIPAQPAGTHVYYYIKGQSNSGKQQVRPMPAPLGNFEFLVLGATGISENAAPVSMKPIYPNPSHGLTCIPVSVNNNTKGSIKIYDMLGKEIAVIFEGEMIAGEKNYFLNSIALDMKAGAYLISVETSEGRTTQKLMVR